MASFAKVSYNLACTYHRDRYINCFCALLAKAGGVFIAQLNIKSWGRRKAVMDLLALHIEEVLSPFNIVNRSIFCTYKMTHGIADVNLPTPSANPNNNCTVCEAMH